VPPVFSPYAITNPASGERFHYYDGEVRETLSTQVARDTGADFIVISTIWGPHGYDERMGTLAHMGMSVLAEQALHQLVEQKVQQDRHQAGQFDRVLQAIETHGARHGVDAPATAELKKQVGELLGHRPARALHVTPDPEDHDFYLSGFFSFKDELVSRCLDAGLRAYQQAAAASPEFFRELDRALAQ
jgi:predicted acylesterase/phospholipase RssA